MLLAVLLLLQLDADPVDGFPPIPPYEISNKNAGARPFGDDRLLVQFGGRGNVRRIADDLVALSVADPRISDIFKASDLVRLRRLLTEQFVYLLGGGGTYTGRDMRSAHKDMGLQTADFAALVDNLQRAMSRNRVPFAAQNKLLAKLAPMKRQMIER